MQQQRPRIGKDAWKACCLTYFPAPVAIITASVVGCATPTVSTPASGISHSPVPEVGIQDSANAPSSARLIYQPGQLRYRLQVSSAVQLIVGDSTHRVDSTRVIGNLDVRLTKIPGREQITAEIRPDSMLLTSGTGTSVPMMPRPLLVFHIDLQSGRITPNEPTGNTPCGRDSSLESPFSGREVLPSTQPRTSSNWVDTSTTTTCRDSVLLTVRRVASYVRLQSPDSMQQVIRSTQFTISGTGYQWGQKVDVNGEGIATDTLHFNGSPFRLQELGGTSRLRVRFRAPLKAQEFIQSTTTHVLLQH